MTDEITAQYFTGASTLTVAPNMRTLPIPLKCIPDLVGAFDGSNICVTQDGDSFVFEITHPWLETSMERVLWRDADTGKLILMWNEQFFLLPEWQRQGLGARSLAIQLSTARRLRIPFVGCLAAGRFDSAMNGYYTWPLLGFDAELDETDIERLPPGLAHCTSLNELFLEDGGAEHWRRHGKPMAVFFDLEPHSTSWAILTEYMEAKGIEL